MIISDRGFDVDPDLAELLGDGSELVAEAAETSCELVEPVHFLAHLARRDGSILRTELLGRRGVDPDLFREQLYATVLDEDRQPGMPLSDGVEAMSEASLHMLDAFADRAAAPENAGEGSFLLVVLAHVPEARALLTAVVGSEQEFEQFSSGLGRRGGASRPVLELFDPDSGSVRSDAFDTSGRRVLTVLREEVAALGYRKATALHLLYALVGIDGGALQSALQFQGVDPLREVHSALALQLRRPAARRAEHLELGWDTLHTSVRLILERAVAEAARDGVQASETHIAKATVAADRGVIADWLTGRGLDTQRLREYLQHAQPVEVEDARERLTPVAEIGDRLRDRILGQEHVIARVLPWVKRLRFGFPRERGPAAVLLFLGPSGSGKTELAKELARTLYGSDEHLLMLEMGQFATKESGNLFIGAPPGYVGYGEGKLTNGLRDKPQSVVLFDEIEKAHEGVWPALLRFLDEGLINDPAGPTRDGRGCVVVLTSNVGADTLARLAPIGRAADDGLDDATEAAIRSEVLKYLKRPEIYNRVDDKIVFQAFDERTYRRLVERQVASEAARFADRGTRVDVIPDVYEWLTSRAMAARAEGARCVPRLTNRHIVSPVIDVLMLGDGTPAETVVVSLCGDGTVVEKG